jgi:hypothetical protein
LRGVTGIEPVSTSPDVFPSSNHYNADLLGQKG